jgi:hypothetical protein
VQGSAIPLTSNPRGKIMTAENKDIAAAMLTLATISLEKEPFIFALKNDSGWASLDASSKREKTVDTVLGIFGYIRDKLQKGEIPSTMCDHQNSQRYPF